MNDTNQWQVYELKLRKLLTKILFNLTPTEIPQEIVVRIAAYLFYTHIQTKNIYEFVIGPITYCCPSYSHLKKTCEYRNRIILNQKDQFLTYDSSLECNITVSKCWLKVKTNTWSKIQCKIPFMIQFLRGAHFHSKANRNYLVASQEQESIKAFIELVCENRDGRYFSELYKNAMRALIHKNWIQIILKRQYSKQEIFVIGEGFTGDLQGLILRMDDDSNWYISTSKESSRKVWKRVTKFSREQRLVAIWNVQKFVWKDGYFSKISQQEDKQQITYTCS